MNANWPPLDFHAHLDPEISPEELLLLRAVVFAATTSLRTFDEVMHRSDEVTVWGVGVHPANPTAISEFTPQRFAEAVVTTPIISEVGLDGRSRVPMSLQKKVFDGVLQVAQDSPRILSVHSSGATAYVLDALQSRPVTGVVLHWWRGTQEETQAAIALGCRFSVNPAELRQFQMPGNLCFAETDHPHGDRTVDKARPGNVYAVERAIAGRTNTPIQDVRRSMWTQLAVMSRYLHLAPLFPERVRLMIEVASTATS